MSTTFLFSKVCDNAQQCLPFHLKQTFPPIIWIFTEGEGDGIKSRLPSKIFSTLSGGFAYPCFCTEKRLALLRKESARNRVPNRYDGHCRNLSDSEIQQKIDEGRPYVVRFVLEKDQNIEFEVEFVKEWVANSPK